MADKTMERRQLATAFSDLVLCAASLYSIKISSDADKYCGLGFLIFAVASGLGTLRFSVLFPGIQGIILKLHQYFSFLGSTSGLPLLAATYCKQTNYEWISIFLIIMSIGGPVSHAIGLLKLNFVRSIGSTLSILSIMVFSLIFNKFGTNISGLGGSFLFILGGIVIGTEGTGILGVANVDWFHYVLSGAVLALANGIK